MSTRIAEHSVLAIADLSPHPRNARKGNVDAITASLQRLGQFRPIVVRAAPDGEGWQLLAGHHVAQAAAGLGWDTLEATIVVADDEQALEIVLADNRTSDLGGYDDRRLAEALAAVTDPAALGFDAAAVDSIFRTSGLLGEQLSRDFTERQEQAAAEQAKVQERINEDRAAQGLPPVRVGLSHSDGGAAYAGGQADAVQFCAMLTSAQRTAVIAKLSAIRDDPDNSCETFGDALCVALGIEPS